MTTRLPRRCSARPSTARSSLLGALGLWTKPVPGQPSSCVGTTLITVTVASATSARSSATPDRISPSRRRATRCTSRPENATRRVGRAPPETGRASTRSPSPPNATRRSRCLPTRTEPWRSTLAVIGRPFDVRISIVDPDQIFCVFGQLRGSVKLLPKNVKRPGTEPPKVRFMDRVVDALSHSSRLTEAGARQQRVDGQTTGSDFEYIVLTAGPVRHKLE
jgi:hypothetical protein